MYAISYVMAYLSTFETKRKEQGATAVEYALVVGLVSLVVVAAVALFGPRIRDFVGTINFRAPAA